MRVLNSRIKLILLLRHVFNFLFSRGDKNTLHLFHFN